MCQVHTCNDVKLYLAVISFDVHVCVCLSRHIILRLYLFMQTYFLHIHSPYAVVSYSQVIGLISKLTSLWLLAVNDTKLYVYPHVILSPAPLYMPHVIITLIISSLMLLSTICFWLMGFRPLLAAVPASTARSAQLRTVEHIIKYASSPCFCSHTLNKDNVEPAGSRQDQQNFKNSRTQIYMDLSYIDPQAILNYCYK